MRTLHTSKNITFMEVNDGSCVWNLQIVIFSPADFPLKEIYTGAGVQVKDYVEEVEDREQELEMGNANF